MRDAFCWSNHYLVRTKLHFGFRRTVCKQSSRKVACRARSICEDTISCAFPIQGDVDIPLEINSNLKLPFACLFIQNVISISYRGNFGELYHSCNHCIVHSAGIGYVLKMLPFLKLFV